MVAGSTDPVTRSVTPAMVGADPAMTSEDPAVGSSDPATTTADLAGGVNPVTWSANSHAGMDPVAGSRKTPRPAQIQGRGARNRPIQNRRPTKRYDRGWRRARLAEKERGRGRGGRGEEIAMQPQDATSAADPRARGGEGWRGAESP
jgi:hypothetical protein